MTTFNDKSQAGQYIRNVGQHYGMLVKAAVNGGDGSLRAQGQLDNSNWEYVAKDTSNKPIWETAMIFADEELKALDKDQNGKVTLQEASALAGGNQTMARIADINNDGILQKLEMVNLNWNVDYLGNPDGTITKDERQKFATACQDPATAEKFEQMLRGNNSIGTLMQKGLDPTYQLPAQNSAPDSGNYLRQIMGLPQNTGTQTTPTTPVTPQVTTTPDQATANAAVNPNSTTANAQATGINPAAQALATPNTAMSQANTGYPQQQQALMPQQAGNPMMQMIMFFIQMMQMIMQMMMQMMGMQPQGQGLNGTQMPNMTQILNPGAMALSTPNGNAALAYSPNSQTGGITTPNNFAPTANNNALNTQNSFNTQIFPALTGNQQSCKANATSYYPDSSALEGGYVDKKGNKLNTLQDYLEGKAPYVSVAMDDKNGLKYGQKLRIPELEQKYGRPIEFRVVDTGGAFRGKGMSRIDICSRNQASSLDPALNQNLTLVIV